MSINSWRDRPLTSRICSQSDQYSFEQAHYQEVQVEAETRPGSVKMSGMVGKTICSSLLRVLLLGKFAWRNKVTSDFVKEPRRAVALDEII